MRFILGKKIEMTQVFKEDGTVIPVTLIEAGPMMITGIKIKDKNGYDAVQFGFGLKKKKNIKKPQRVQFESKGDFAFIREFRIKKLQDLEPLSKLNIGDSSDVSMFNAGDIVKVSGISKGKGFQGAVKRHGFHGMPASHGHKHVLRHVGSIGQRFPQHTLKGTRMAGHMGAERITTKGLEVIKIDKEHNILALKGAVPGRRGTLLEITGL